MCDFNILIYNYMLLQSGPVSTGFRLQRNKLQIYEKNSFLQKDFFQSEGMELQTKAQ